MIAPRRVKELKRAGSMSDLPVGGLCAIGGSTGYSSLIGYTILSFLGQQIANIGVNETFASVVDDYVGNNWPTYTASGETSDANGKFADQICMVFPNGKPPSLPPQSPLSSTKIDHGSQFWFVGSTLEASGVEVQGDTLQRYQDHGRHLSIVSPTR